MAMEPAAYADIRTAAQAASSERAAFIRRTYLHLAGALLLFVVLEYILLNMPFAQAMAVRMMGSHMSWLVVLVLFMAVSWVAERWARSSTSLSMQYLGLGVYVLAEAIIFLPLLYIVVFVAKDPNIIPSAGLLTLTLFAGLTGTVFITRKDFSFLRGILMVGGFVAIGVIVVAMLFGFSLGTFFSLAMVALAGGYMLFHTSNIMRHYRTDQHVSAALALFASVALMLWYIILLFMDRD